MRTCITFDDISPKHISPLQLKLLLDLLDKIDIKCTLFVIPCDLTECSSNNEFITHLKTAVKLGHELAQHGYMHGSSEIISEFGCIFPFPFPNYHKQIESIKKGRNIITKLVGVKPLGFRAPFYLHNKFTFRALNDLVFIYDSSKTVFKPAHGVNFRLKVLNNSSPFKIGNITEIPVTGDYTYNLNYNSLSSSVYRAINDFLWVTSHDGVFVMNNHPNHLLDKGYVLLKKFLKTIVDRLSFNTEFMRLSDLV